MDNPYKNEDDNDELKRLASKAEMLLLGNPAKRQLLGVGSDEEITLCKDVDHYYLGINSIVYPDLYDYTMNYIDNIKKELKERGSHKTVKIGNTKVELGILDNKAVSLYRNDDISLYRNDDTRYVNLFKCNNTVVEKVRDVKIIRIHRDGHSEAFNRINYDNRTEKLNRTNYCLILNFFNYKNVIEMYNKLMKGKAELKRIRNKK